MSKVRQWTIATALGCLAVLAVGWFVLISAERSHASQLRLQVAAQQQQNMVLGNELQARRAQSKDLPTEQALLAKYAAQIPATPELPSLIRQLSTAAASAGVDLKSLSPATPSLAGGSATGSAASASSPTANSLAQITVNLQVVGTYYNVEEFVNSLEHLGRSMLISTISLAPGGSVTTGSSTTPTAAPVAGQSPTLSATITARVFMNAQTAPAATPSAAATK
jgi:Tfp pilus assembly protein PilO